MWFKKKKAINFQVFMQLKAKTPKITTDVKVEQLSLQERGSIGPKKELNHMIGQLRRATTKQKCLYRYRLITICMICIFLMSFSILVFLS